MEQIETIQGSMMEPLHINFIVLTGTDAKDEHFIDVWSSEDFEKLMSKAHFSLVNPSNYRKLSVYGIQGKDLLHIKNIEKLHEKPGTVSSWFESEAKKEMRERERLVATKKVISLAVIKKEISNLKDLPNFRIFLNNLLLLQKRNLIDFLEKRIEQVELNKSLTGKAIYYYLTTPFDYINFNPVQQAAVIEVEPIIKNWGFTCANEKTLKISLALCEIIKHRIAPDMAAIAKQNLWYEQCALFELKNSKNDIDYKFIHQHVEFNNQYSYNIGLALFEQTQDLETLKYLIKACIHHGKKDDSVYYSHCALNKFKGIVSEDQETEIKRLFIQSLTNRNAKRFTCKDVDLPYEISDAQYALNLTMRTTFRGRNLPPSEKVIDSILTDEFKEGRGEATNIFGDMGRGLKRFSKGLGKTLGGSDSEIPHSPAIINSVPKMLDFNQVTKAIGQSNAINKELEKLLSNKQRDAAITAMGLSITGSMIWTYSQIDRTVLDAISFASAGNPDNFFDLQEIAKEAIGSEGAITRLTGYVAEQKVAFDLASSGQTVEFPDAANQVGYDLLVNGEPFQVKNSLDADYVLNHLDTYPDIPVFVNRELAEALGDNPMIIPVDSLSFNEVQEITASSFEALDNFGSAMDLIPIPIFAIGFSAYNNFSAYNKGIITGGHYFKNVGVEAASMAGGAAIGQAVLGGVGAVFGGPVGYAVGTGLGGVIGGMAGSTAADAINKPALCNQREVVVKELTEFARWFNKSLIEPKLESSKNRRDEVREVAKNFDITSPMTSSFYAYHHEAYERLSKINQWFNKALTSDNESLKTNAGWVALDLSKNFVSAELNKRIAEVNKQLQKYEKIKNPPAKSTAGVSETQHAINMML